MSNNQGSAANAAEGELNLNAQESKFFMHLMKYLPKNLEVDWDKFAREMNFKSGEVAKTRCRQIRTKHGIYGAVPQVLRPNNADTKVTKGPNGSKGRKGSQVTKSKQPKHDPEATDDIDEDDKSTIDVKKDEF